jgi:hypothetical protein
MGLNSARYYQETAAIPGAHGLTALPLDYGIQLGQAIVEHLPEGGVVYAEVEGWVLNSLAGKTFPVVQDARAPAFNFIPRQGGVYVAAHPPGADTTLGPLRAERAVTMQLPDGWTLTVDTFAPISAETFRGAQMMDIPSEQGIRLCCYELTHHGNEWTLTTYWRVDFLAEGVEAWLFAPFAHVFDATGERVLILDGAVVPGERWHEGDYHAHRMRFSLPTDRRGPFRLMMGQYDSVRQENAIFRPPDGSYIPLVALPDELER